MSKDSNTSSGGEAQRRQRKTLRELRMEHKLSQMKLAVLMGVNISTIAKLEGGYVQPKVDIARRAAEALGVSMDDMDWPIDEERKREIAARRKTAKADTTGPKRKRAAAA